MITIAASGSTLRTAKYLHHRDQVSATKSMRNSTTDCCFCSCDSEIPAFADGDNPTDKFKNDIFSWLIKVPNLCTLVATLTNLDTNVSYTITDDTYGDLYTTGTLKTNVWGYIIKWGNVADLIGFGNYQMNITITDSFANIISNKDYPKFKLMPYSCENVHGTVRIETWNTGYIEGGFDYRNIFITTPFANINPYSESVPLKGWVQQIRYYGRVDISGIPVQIDNLSDNYRNLLQVQTQIQNEWTLRLEFIKTDISTQIIYDNLLADYILLSDYNANSVNTYRDVKVSLISIDSPQNFANRTSIFNVKFADYKQNNLKRFY